ncbi:AraC family transcriptional regulator [[Clostridium] polysaccharolyticum]|jgi:AraC family transcriptional regulator of arabinose operon|uniref:AraC family transcriptional regulator, arabinose operon regulatory protein n=1 Tax=[Clostridium] polysaccharolyticum TaxID=29364 RepID=A0A1I0DVY1_9FIRM|nr:AraC family transcriptional regulator [[Clostridium] polysaccharolyticum]SET36019.1 AraC family transcriptional regulator, arabinose operon regulatory protein [[Clostridium] polysaccharolyticum]
MKLISIGYNHVHDESFEVNRPNGIDSWLFLLIRTPGVFRYDQKELVVKENSFVLFSNDFPHCYKAYNQNYADDWFHFIATDEDIAFFHSLNIPINQVVSLADTSSLNASIRNMIYEFNSDNLYKSELIEINYRLLFYKLARVLCNNHTYYPTKDSIYFARMQALRNDIYNNPQIDRSVDSMAAELSMSRSAFQHNYKNIFGRSIITDIINSRLRKVKYYLTTTDMTLEDIAAQCGYHNQLHLIRQFKQHCGLTPTQYRKCR